MQHKNFRASTPILLLLLLVSFSIFTEANAQKAELSFRENGKFKIVQFTDVHWDPQNPEIKEASETMSRILDKEQPDLIIYTGDIITGSPTAEAIDSVFMIAEKRNTPFAFTFGNHDDESDMTRQEIYETLKKFEYNITTTTNGISGITNYIVELKGHNNRKNEALIYIIDSHAYSPLHEKGITGYDWIKHDQVEWYLKESKIHTEENGGEALPALAFFHIPIPEYNMVANDESFKLSGHRLEKPCAPIINTGLGAAMLIAGDVMATSVGHDHVNDYVADYHGLKLIYGRSTGGKLTYGDIPGGQGARVFELTEGIHSFSTWVVLKDGTIVSELTL